MRNPSITLFRRLLGIWAVTALAGWTSLPAEERAETLSVESMAPARLSLSFDEAPPLPSWSQGAELVTFETVCHEEQVAEQPGAEDEEVIVIELDQSTVGQRLDDRASGLAIELTQDSSGAYRLEIRMDSPRLEECAGLGEEELRPLPAPEFAGVDLELADFQTRYAALVAAGKDERARQMADHFLGGACPCEQEIPRRLPDALLTDSTGRLEHRVSYHPTESVMPSRRDWNSVADRLISYRFRGADAHALAGFLEIATGLAVEVRLSDEEASSLRCHAEASDAPIRTAIEEIGRSAGLQITPAGDHLVISKR